MEIKYMTNREPEEDDRVAAGLIGGGLLGAALGGPTGAVIGGIIGAILAEEKNKEEKGPRDL